MKKKTGIGDVAKRAKVSPSVVSRVINRSPLVKPETLRRVQKAMEELQYRPGPRGCRSGQRPRLGGRRTKRIALLTIGSQSIESLPSFYMSMIHGVEEALSEHGQTMVFRRLAHEDEIDGKLFQSKVDGVILFARLNSDKSIGIIRRYPCVEVMGPIPESGYWDHVSYNNPAIGRLAAGHFLSKGISSCGMIVDCMPSPLWEGRCGEFRRTIEKAGGKVAEFSLKREGNNWYCPDAEIAAGKNQIGGLFVPGDQITLALYPRLQERGVRIGEDLEIVSCDNVPSLSTLSPRPASVDLHSTEIGHRAVEQLLWRIGHTRDSRVAIAVDVELKIY